MEAIGCVAKAAFEEDLVNVEGGMERVPLSLEKQI